MLDYHLKKIMNPSINWNQILTEKKKQILLNKGKSFLK